MENDSKAAGMDRAGKIPGSQAAMGCACGQPRTVGVMHRSEGPCQAVYATVPVAESKPAHPDDIAVDAFAAAMKEKMAKQRAKGYGGWDDRVQCTDEYLAECLMRHAQKGDPVDVANFCMMLHQRHAGDNYIVGDVLRIAALDFAKRVASMWIPDAPASGGEALTAVQFVGQEKTAPLTQDQIENIAAHGGGEALSEVDANNQTWPAEITLGNDGAPFNGNADGITWEIGRSWPHDVGYIRADLATTKSGSVTASTGEMTNGQLWQIIDAANEQIAVEYKDFSAITGLPKWAKEAYARAIISICGSVTAPAAEGASERYCGACRGEGMIHTGIDEAPTTLCKVCEGSGIATKEGAGDE